MPNTSELMTPRAAAAGKLYYMATYSGRLEEISVSLNEVIGRADYCESQMGLVVNPEAIALMIEARRTLDKALNVLNADIDNHVEQNLLKD